ncbi:pimeloyl-ACP methyl ester carboxylesterase [Allocatelliglobosispora scoriae]|uniref:Pimeloyl-ACP methyl ester carboxylesterase n=1 Tax=Allocatelliglobosispora scoriae TaxID=643052 RepID=A0A841BPV2_9ACTN|nr:alpha/beta hydrolase [Allocatelliglobosispora scoriae]MBB5869715.1 pimeloyl-ACP methyl ester carboxylesterase [Allocatelliglobosispora scoriae]
MSSIVLIPGAWLGGWAWERVTDELRNQGHDVWPVTLSGVAERAAEAGPETDLEQHVSEVVGLIEGEDLRDVLLVGHSYGGMVVSTAAGRIADRIGRVVYVDSGPLPEGVSQFDTNGPQEQVAIREQVGAGYVVPPPPFDPAAEPQTLAGLSDADLATLRERATPHPFASLTQGVSYTPEYAKLPATLFACTIPGDAARQMIEDGHPYFAMLAGADVIELPTGHWPMFSEPQRLAEILATLT